MILGRTTQAIPSFDGVPEQFAVTSRFKSALLVSEHGMAGGMAMPVAHWRSRLEDDATTPGYSHHSVILQRAGNDVRRIDAPRFASHRSAPGRILIIPAGMRAAWRSPTVSDRVHFYLRPELLGAIASELGYPTPELRDDRIFIEDEALRVPLERYFRGIESSGVLERELATVDIAIGLLRRHGARALPAASRGAIGPRQERRLRDAIEDAIDTECDLASIAAKAGLPPVTVKRVARRVLGLPLHQFVIERRLARARDMILAGKPIVDAALASGFSSQSHLTKQMRQRWGVTPGYLRRSHR